MKICIVVPYFTPYVRGNEYGLAQSLTELGHEVTIIASTGKAPREKMVAKNAREFYYEFKVEYLPTILDIGENPIVPSAFIHIFKNNYDLILLQEDYQNICHLAYVAAKIKKIPTILSTERTYYPENFAKRVLLKWFDKTINKIIRNGVEVYTAHCTAAQDFVIKELKVPREVKVIPVGVDINLFYPQKNKNQYLKEGDFKILTVARLHNYKGLEYLIKAMKIVIAKHPNAKLYILGKGAERENLENLIKDLNLNSNIIFIKESIPNPKMPELYAECDLYVQPSIIEPYGIAVLEAMACGKPVIGTKVGGMLDTIKDGKTGFLVEPRDYKELAKKILEIHNIKEEFGRSARERVMEGFDWKGIAIKYLQTV
ncbi:MAG TPA: glycosyltransferase family 1 protein [Methanosarcinales archaeon]|nr:glycosyltransferase family 1 protein [Methanosarcinales archaeon]